MKGLIPQLFSHAPRHKIAQIALIWSPKMASAGVKHRVVVNTLLREHYPLSNYIRIEVTTRKTVEFNGCWQCGTV